jgi:DegV family protein with EDD domain
VILRAAEAIEAGCSHDEVAALAEKWVNQTKIFVSMSTLKYMVRGGRISMTKGFIARLMNINPIITIDESGKAVMLDRAFNQKNNMEKVMSHIRRHKNRNKVWNYIVLHANNTYAAGWYTEKMQKLTGQKPVSVVNISPVIGANTGVGAAAVALLYD